METTLTHAPPTALALDTPLEPEALRRLDAYWRAANYLAVGQIYLYDNPLLREPLTLAHLKPLLPDKLVAHKQYIYRYGQDMPEIRDWQWVGKGEAGARSTA
ncbi:hypothetical protein QMK33_15185 [Hymenobacter sp. H14-R3]|uniref:hypothetical protein n=1 Tax=Hymenobacter sp. H14-R3 TaxID=3046308 RepID=UPI0024BBB8F7|nr:hypothetical protein [Hymenobacter sp. H14-R3]MDJ0366502.1 hypothetical protein [Hymenobacter sp. H14-R3]